MYMDDDVGAIARGGVRFPDFICLGAQKAATTWLTQTLRHTPNIWLPPIKELHYFSQLYNRDARDYAPAHRAAQVDEYKTFFPNLQMSPRKRQLTTELLDILSSPKVNDQWYGSIFRCAPNYCVAAEVCPSYMNIPISGMHHLLSLAPAVKLLILVRDPIDRCWSHMRMHMTRGALERNVASFMESDAALSPFIFYTDYAYSIHQWERLVPKERFMIALQDDIEADPAQTLAIIAAFAGAPIEGDAASRLDEAVFKGEAIDMPTELRKKLLSELRPQYEFLGARYPAKVKSWLNRHHAALTQ